MNIALIFAGGTGARMNTKGRPKQFLELNGKPILIHTIEVFDNHPEIDGIVVVCIESWIPFLEDQLKKFGISKILCVVSGGKNGQESIYKGLCAIDNLVEKTDKTIVLLHDGVRPLINEETISNNISSVTKYGNCITCAPVTETVIIEKMNDGVLKHEAPNRSDCYFARAPQSFYLQEILDLHRRAIRDGLDCFVDSCSMFEYYGGGIFKIIGPIENIKITTPSDFFIFRAILQVRESQQIFGF